MLTEKKRRELIDKLTTPTKRIDAVLDTDAYNEIDDQFAISYMLACPERINILAFYAAPFHNSNSSGAADGMERSYNEIKKLLTLSHNEKYLPLTYRGSTEYLPNETTPIESDAARDLVRLANGHTEEDPLYVVAIGAITNVASALLLDPTIVDRIVIVWLGGHAHFTREEIAAEGFSGPRHPAGEFNMRQDIAAARVVFNSGAPVVQLPCCGVVDRFAIDKQGLTDALSGKNELCDYLLSHSISQADRDSKGAAWRRVIWDVTAVAWLTNDGDRFMHGRITAAPIPEYDRTYSFDSTRNPICYVDEIKVEALFGELFGRITK